MVLRFRSVPVEPDGAPLLDDIRPHEARFSAAEPYFTAAWISAGVFAAATCLIFLLCLLARKAGYHILLDGEERYLPPFLGFLVALPAFTAALNAEVRLIMHMRTLEDRDCKFGRFRFEPEVSRGTRAGRAVRKPDAKF